jgi:hypothetical protein
LIPGEIDDKVDFGLSEVLKKSNTIISGCEYEDEKYLKLSSLSMDNTF